MRILAIDTALDCCAAAVLDTSIDEIIAMESLPMTRGHAEALMPLIARIMGKARMPFAEIDRVAVTTGPGSFTGLRVGISAARGIALAAGKPVVGVTTLSAYAAPLVSKQRPEPIISAIDARHDHLYFQALSGNGAVLTKPSVISIDAAVGAARFGPARIVGNAAALLASRWPAHSPPASVDPTAAPDIVWVALMGSTANPNAAPPKPFYLRAPDAKPNVNRVRPAAPRSPPRP
jgi:tRNA threonylcarbamoyl adenosine modification protein YeaZ